MITDDYVAINQYLVDRVKANANLLGADPDNIFYGDREKIGAVPTITVFAASQSYDLGENMHRTDNRMLFYAVLYFGKVQELTVNIKQTDEKVMILKRIFNGDLQWGGLVTNGYVRAIDPGYATRSGVLLRAARLTLEGYNRTMLTGV